MADDALILGHRNSEWTGHGPILEQDIALSNIALDLVGQARNFYQLAAQRLNAGAFNEGNSLKNNQADYHRKISDHERIISGHDRTISGEAVTEDRLAYLRDTHEFRNHLLVELPNGDWAKTILRQFCFSHYQFILFNGLEKGADRDIAAIAEKSIKETRYHLKWSGEWVLRLGDGTEESHQRMLRAMEDLNQFIPELFSPANYETELAGKGQAVSPEAMEGEWYQRVNDIFVEAGLPVWQAGKKDNLPVSGKNGIHTEHLGHLLAEMQFLQRTYPGSEW